MDWRAARRCGHSAGSCRDPRRRCRVHRATPTPDDVHPAGLDPTHVHHRGPERSRRRTAARPPRDRTPSRPTRPTRPRDRRADDVSPTRPHRGRAGRQPHAHGRGPRFVQRHRRRRCPGPGRGHRCRGNPAKVAPRQRPRRHLQRAPSSGLTGLASPRIPAHGAPSPSGPSAPRSSTRAGPAAGPAEGAFHHASVSWHRGAGSDECRRAGHGRDPRVMAVCRLRPRRPAHHGGPPPRRSPEGATDPAKREPAADP